ncbi:hypothetical protein BBJ29_003774 [Phytophthora kernoviae]|uniref:Rab-GAP TBC domain-containing protein n=1 Tax=Phytophthora kernoviae TaxID=325452 RepID=A0A3F2RXV9_9STRA|nr:hypothetical protein BBJ29_003774 [Phytophthora kernoviae]RLN66322.1 hypothetical protein BBP00_00002313 [Phytophthora kernoviae]
MLQDLHNRGVKLSEFVLHSLANFAEASANPVIALDILAVMKSEGMQPSIEIYMSILIACAKCKQWIDVIKVYESMPKELQPQLQGKHLGSVIKAHTNSGSDELKLRGLSIFGQSLGKVSGLVGNSAMQALFETGQFETLIALADDMRREGVELSRSTYSLVIRTYIRSGSVDKARELLHANASYLRNHSSEIYVELIEYYAMTRGDIQEACQICTEMIQGSKLRFSDWCNALELAMKLPDSSLYWEIRKGTWIHAESFESKLPAHLIQPHPSSTQDKKLLPFQDDIEQTITKAAAIAPEVSLALEVYNDARNAGGVDLSQILASRVLATMGKHGRVDDCVEMLSYFKEQEVSPKPYARAVAFRALHDAQRFSDALAAVEDVIHDGSLKNTWACAKALHIADLSGRHELVVEIFEHMRRDGMKLSDDTYGNVIKSYSREKQWESAFKLLTSMQTKGPKPTIGTYGWLLTTLNKEGERSKVIEVYDSMPNDLRLRLHGPVLRAVLMAHAAVEDDELQLRLLKICNEHKTVCKEFPYQTALVALVESKQYAEALSLVDDMKAQGLKLSPTMYQTMVLAYIRSGAMEQARQLLQDNYKRLSNASAICYRELIHYYAEELKDVSEAAKLSVDMMQNNTQPKLKSGPLLLEVGQPPEWKPFEVVLAGSSPADVGLYYYPHKDETTPMGCIRLQNAHIDCLEEVLMVVAKDKTWFLCADYVRDANDWCDAICNAIERVNTDGVIQQPDRRLHSSASAVSLTELQSRGSKARVNEFLEVFRPEEFLTVCETTTDHLLYNIYKDVRRTRGEMEFFRDPVVQCLLIRVLYVYSVTHSEISYNQGMGELLATLVYLLHVEQWPLEEDDLEQVLTGEYDVEPTGRLSGSYFFPAYSPSKDQTESSSTEEEDTYVYVESFINIQSDDSFLDRDSFLRMVPFAGGSGKYYECCRDAADEIVRELTAAECVEHDAYLLLEEIMLRMAGTYCPNVPLSRKNSKPQMEKPISSADQLPVSPLDDQMNRIHHHILSRCDPPTARHLANLGVEPQMFLLRWVRVLMAREFETSQVWQIWDAIFSLTPSDFSFINLLCVAVVREFRDNILATEDSTSVLLSLRDIADRIEPTRLIDNARELYDALLIAAAVEASMGSA